MSVISLRQALTPSSQRLQRPAHEAEVMRLSATLIGRDRSSACDMARREVLKWVQNRSGRLPDEAWDGQGFDHLAGGRNTVGVRLRTDDVDIWAIRADDPDKTVAGRIWTTEVVIGSLKTEPPRLSARLSLSTTESEPDIEPHAPGFFQQLALGGGLGVGVSGVAGTPMVVATTDDADHLVDLLLDPSRASPVFVITVPDGGSAPLVSADPLARATLGLAIVALVPAQVTWRITERVGKKGRSSEARFGLICPAFPKPPILSSTGFKSLID